MAKLYEKGDEMDEDTIEIQQVVYTHRFIGRVSTYFLHTLQFLNGQYGRHSTILLQYMLDFSRICYVRTHNFLLAEGLVHKKFVKAVSFHYLVIKSNF